MANQSNQKIRRLDREQASRVASEITPRRGWASSQIGGESYFFLAVCVIAQVATILITWPTWQVRMMPPNLPWLPATPQFSCGVLLIVSLGGTLISPRRFGMAIHIAMMAIAVGMDQFRCQPQILSIELMMAACVWAPARRICVWFFVSMWLWAGIHKFMSADWFMHVSYNLLSDTGIYARNLHFGFALIIATSELLLGLTAWLRPKSAILGCIVLHVGIAIFLLIIGWNPSVLPWNICTALVAAWLLWNADTTGTDPTRLRLAVPAAWYEKIAIVALLTVPVGLYFGLVRPCFSHALYSANLPVALATHENGIDPLEVWDDLQFPFPNVHKAYRDYFEMTAVVGDKLHIRDPRGISTQYLWMDPTGRLKEITVDEFFASNLGSVEGIALDDPRKVYLLEKGNATMLKRSEKEMIYAVKFDPGGFDAQLISHLRGLPNLEQIQLADCEVNDEDLKQLFGLKKLMGIGLDNTSVTDAGLKNLRGVPGLIVLEHEGTAITEKGLNAIGVPR